MIPPFIKIKNDELPERPGVYFYYGKEGIDGKKGKGDEGVLLYIGKATSLKKRVGSYFTKAHNARIAELVSKIRRIDYIETPTVIEALVLEANQIHAKQPPYNILVKDDKSFLYLCFTNEQFPRPILLRGFDLERLGIEPFSQKLTPIAKRYFLHVFGPYTSGRAVKMALDLIRPALPWSICTSPGGTDFPLELFSGQRAFGFRRGSKDGRPCFDAQIEKCPGVCTGLVTKQEYTKTIRRLVQFFSGKKTDVLKDLRRLMERAAKEHRFEEAANYRNKVFALEHIRDVGLIMREDEEVSLPFIKQEEGSLNILGRIEAYDLAHISGTSYVGAMTVFQAGRPAKEEYRRFKIKTVFGSDDVAGMEEMLRRRFARSTAGVKKWPMPDVLVIDGGEGQVHAAERILKEFHLEIPLIGIAKGFDRKQDRMVFDRSNTRLVQFAQTHKEIFQKVRDEAHRFAGAYHRILRSQKSGIPRRKHRERVQEFNAPLVALWAR